MVFGRRKEPPCGFVRIGEAAPAGGVEERGQLVQRAVRQFVHSLEMLHQREGGGCGVLNILALRQTAAFLEQQVPEPLFLMGKVLNGVKSCPGQGPQHFIAVAIHVDLVPDPAEAETVRDDESVNVVVLW